MTMTDTENKSILVVDDEEVIREFLGEVLGEDYSVTMACDGDDAIEKIRQSRFDLIITDLKMPNVGGEEVVKFARALDADYRVIIISGYSTLYAASQSVSSGACAFLSKPFSVSELMQAVSSSLQT